MVGSVIRRKSVIVSKRLQFGWLQQLFLLVFAMDVLLESMQRAPSTQHLIVHN